MGRSEGSSVASSMMRQKKQAWLFSHTCCFPHQISGEREVNYFVGTVAIVCRMRLAIL
jgi:hypothetical protein